MTPALAAGGVAGGVAGLLVLAWWWRRPGLVSSLAAAVVICDLVAVPWSAMAALTIGPSGPLDLTRRDPVGSYARLLAGPTGNAAEFGAVMTAIAVGVLLAGRRRRRRRDARRALGSPPPAASRTPSGVIPHGRGSGTAAAGSAPAGASPPPGRDWGR